MLRTLQLCDNSIKNKSRYYSGFCIFCDLCGPVAGPDAVGGQQYISSANHPYQMHSALFDAVPVLHHWMLLLNAL